MDEKIYYFTAINRGTIEIVDNDKIIIKFENELKNRIKSRMIYKTQRLYSFDSKIDDIDDVINTKIDDILDYEYYLELDTTSTYYKNYHSTTEYDNSFKIVYTKQELNDLLNIISKLFGAIYDSNFNSFIFFLTFLFFFTRIKLSLMGH